MSKRANPTMVGAFVLGAVGLAVAGVVVFGSATLLKKQAPAVAYFDGDVAGLDVGAPVTIQGVRVGAVTDVRLRLDETTLTTVVPVFMELDPERLNVAAGDFGTGKRLGEAIQKGLRAQLVTVSLVTGQRQVELRYAPDSQARQFGYDT